jgi:drug/metabolite transporter (DMT)-like permease
MSAAVALVWGSSFLWIAIAIDDVDATFVPLARIGFGALALACIPAARHRLPTFELPRVVFLGLVWMAIPFLLFPLAEETTSSAVAGMINGSLPVVTVAVTAVFTRRLPSRQRVAAVTVGFVGIALVSLGSLGRGGGADVRGIAMLIAAVVCYAIAVNVAAPLQRRYGSLPLLLHVQVAGVLWTLPTGMRGAQDSDVTWQAMTALVLLGALGTGLAFALYGLLVERTGPVRGMIGIFFTPAVAAILGVGVRDEPLRLVAVAGMVVVVVGAVMTSRPDP